ncbi:pimeloyl-ACP methyl ester carboxylesterase [Nocardioides aromaticivorans]|uniref:Pimeloyl-ACP methyl ester carboxylesterase n=1 Tax=Nocardioides aromaticivorans TaxID=200618 RepID=A0A7Y9ZDL3_9ACTN|nr:alpha/beta fold hydrolase [Nocardioides aromaticivorans]NYI43437.1 pimeloyl-ACP methyl ester carboxylesterase [Nocardioides aromaticivorans]
MSTLVRLPDGAELDVTDLGDGPDVLLLVQTALTADELLPVAQEPALAGWRRVLPHRRGYDASGPALDPPAVRDDAADCIALLDALDLPAAHLLGFSYSTAVVLEVAATWPERVASVVLVEPPPVHTAFAGEFAEVNAELAGVFTRDGAEAALDALLSRLLGADWHPATEAALPGSVAQMERDAATFFVHDMPALLAWGFDATRAGRVRCPVLHVAADGSGPWFAASRDLALQWFPHALQAEVAGADHGLMLTHPADVAAAVAAFLGGARVSPA